MTTADASRHRRKTRTKKPSRFLQLKAVASDPRQDAAEIARADLARAFPQARTINLGHEKKRSLLTIPFEPYETTN
jgi:hypothetical protein